MGMPIPPGYIIPSPGYMRENIPAAAAMSAWLSTGIAPNEPSIGGAACRPLGTPPSARPSTASKNRFQKCKSGTVAFFDYGMWVPNTLT